MPLVSVPSEAPAPPAQGSVHSQLGTRPLQGTCVALEHAPAPEASWRHHLCDGPSQGLGSHSQAQAQEVIPISQWRKLRLEKAEAHPTQFMVEEQWSCPCFCLHSSFQDYLSPPWLALNVPET